MEAAAICVERPGTIDSIPTRKEVEDRMEIFKARS
jgi:sugar/nucleoside kinase (ribokinase family)